MPEEEADGVRAALTAAGIQFYETPRSEAFRGNVSPTEAIWVANDADAPPAIAVIENFEAEWQRSQTPYQPQTPPAFHISSGKTQLLMLLIGILLVLLLAIVAQK